MAPCRGSARWGDLSMEPLHLLDMPAPDLCGVSGAGALRGPARRPASLYSRCGGRGGGWGGERDLTAAVDQTVYI
jgi:hypothetical protein